MSKAGRCPAKSPAVTAGDRPWQALWQPAGRRSRSTPLLPRAFLNDHASDEDSSLVLPLRAVEDRTISNASIAAGNYFFEWCVWIGYAVYCFAFGAWGLVALAPQAIIFASIWGVTGIRPTEAQSIRSRGDVYREYQKRVSKFVPMPPKRA